VIDELWIDEGFRRKGLGEKLLRASIKNAKTFFEKDGFVLRKFWSPQRKITSLQ